VSWAARSNEGFRHPRETEQNEVEGFLTMLATEKQVAPATGKKARIWRAFSWLKSV
jgi:hypothetical protein